MIGDDNDDAHDDDGKTHSLHSTTHNFKQFTYIYIYIHTHTCVFICVHIHVIYIAMCI